MEEKLKQLQETLNAKSLEYIKSHITTTNLNTQVIAGLAFVDGANYIIDQLTNE
jgi:hypothetical protein